jgi:cytochrome c-type biogenesis protein CcmH/NrfG
LALKQKDQLAEARDELRQAVRLDPDLVEGYYTLGVASWQAGDFDDAATQFSAAVQKKPIYPEAWYMLGTVLKQQGQAIGATAALKEAIRLDPGAPGPYNLLAQLLRPTEPAESKRLFAEGARLKAQKEAEQKAMFDRGTAERPRRIE